jgi:glycosyltransferase involved in cell wall biosynthesis
MASRLLWTFRDWVEMPDRAIDWYPFALSECRRAVREEGIDVLYSKHPPYTAALVCARLSRLTGLPWIMDIPDIWTHDFNYGRRGLARRMDSALEHYALARAHTIVVQSEGCADIVRRLHPATAGKLQIVPMAYDEKTFQAVQEKQAGLFNVVYAGTVYHPHQDLRPFLQALSKVRERGVDISRFRFQYMGRDSDLVSELARAAGVTELVETLGQLPYDEALARQKGAGALLYLQWEPGGEISPTGKLMQYLGARRPILALAPRQGEADRLLSATSAGVVARNSEDVADVLGGWLDEYNRTGDVSYDGHAEALDWYSYDSQAARLAQILSGAARGTPAGERASGGQS